MTDSSAKSSPKNIWVQDSSGICYPAAQTIPSSVNPGVYDLCMTGQGKWFLSPRQKRFDLPKKVYGLESAFIKRVLTSFESSDKNLGILLNGLKGTGKTVTGKIIANESGLPVINVTFAHPAMLDILSQIDFPAIIFIDEYEKIFQEDNRGLLLSLMDGTQKSASKLLFILTTNTMSVNPNLIDRPSRIRYVKQYGNLSKENITEIVRDTLAEEHKDKEPNVIEAVSRLSQLTIDLVIEIVRECNIHGETPDQFMDFFNANKGGHKKTYSLIDPKSDNEVYKIVTESYISQYTAENFQLFNSHDHCYIYFKKATGADKAIFSIPNPAIRLANIELNQLRRQMDKLERADQEESEEYKKISKEYDDKSNAIDEIEDNITQEFKYKSQSDTHYVFSSYAD